MSKEYLKNKWRKLDNTAKIFSLEDKNNINIFRYSIILKQNVNKSILKQSLEMTLNYYQTFKVKIGTGLFWNYLEYNEKEPIIKKEEGIPCNYINFKENNDYLFKITYYKKKINLDVFHVLTDGTGAIEFLKSITYNYLSLKHKIPFNKMKNNNQIDNQDEYLKKYDKRLKVKSNSKIAYQFKEKINKNTNNTYHYIIDINEIKKVCKKHCVTITEYLTATYIYAIYSSIYKKNSKKEIIVTIPINARKLYQVNTLSNFFVCMDINSKIFEKKLTTFKEVLNQVHKEFKENLTEEKIKEYMTSAVKLGTNLPIRLIPLFIKKNFIKFASTLINRNTTTTLSNVGIINIEPKYKKYIDNVLVLILPSKTQKIKCTICSFDNNLNVTMNSNIDDLKFEQTFLKLLKKEINNIKLESNNHINLIQQRLLK